MIIFRYNADMILIAGLGNIGPKYAHTRHNIGFMALDKLADPTKWRLETKSDADTQAINLDGAEALLAKPTTMMNNSGQAVGKLAQLHRIAPEDIWIVYDELDLPLGRLKISTGSSDNGHNGLISISSRLGHNRFWRFRIGIDTRQHREIPGPEYVLQDFPSSEEQALSESLDLATNAIKTALLQSPPAAMQRYNRTAQPSKE